MDERVLTLTGRRELVAELRAELTRGPQPTHDVDAADATTATLLRIVHDTTNWRDRAVCRTDPRATNGDTPAAVAKALSMCARCPVIQQCDAWVSLEPDFRGVAGGRIIGDPRAKNREAAA